MSKKIIISLFLQTGNIMVSAGLLQQPARPSRRPTSCSESPIKSAMGLQRGSHAVPQPPDSPLYAVLLPHDDDNQVVSSPQDECPLKDGCPASWTWSPDHKSHEVRLYGPKHETAHFHPNWSNGTAAVRSNAPLNRGRHYWEVRVSQRIFGTSMMWGICTDKQRLHVDAFVNLLGENEHGWGLSHKGTLWHNGAWRQYTEPFRENEPTTIGMLYDGNVGTLNFYKDGRDLGLAFSDLHLVKDAIFPAISSTAAKTEMYLCRRQRGYTCLQDRCRNTIVRHMKHPIYIDYLPLPSRVVEYVRDAAL